MRSRRSYFFFNDIGFKRFEILVCFMSFKYNYIIVFVRVRILGEEVNIVCIYILFILNFFFF